MRSSVWIRADTCCAWRVGGSTAVDEAAGSDYGVKTVPVNTQQLGAEVLADY
jgi:hypothetical protein